MRRLVWWPRSLAAACLVVMAIAASGTAAMAARKPTSSLTPVTYTIASAAVTPLNIDFAVAQAAGFMKQQGLTLKVLPLGSDQASTEAVRQGKADFAVGVPSYQIPTVARGNQLDMVNFFEYTYPFKWDVAVLKSSPYHSLSQLKGQTIGVQSFGVSDYLMGQKLFNAAGVNPGSGIHWLATGDGTPAAHALASGQVAAMVSYDTTVGGWKANHLVNYRLLPVPKGVPEVGGLYLSTSSQYLQSHRSVAVGFAKAVAEANVFCQANPLEASKMFYDVYPQALPPDQTKQQAAKLLVTTVSQRLKEYSPYFKGHPAGYINPSEWTSEVAFAGDTGKVDPTQFYTNSLIPQATKFSVANVQQKAKNWGKKK